MIFFLMIFTLLAPVRYHQDNNSEALTGAWEATMPDGSIGLLIVSDLNFSLTSYQSDPPEFLYTEGGKWKVTGDGALALEWEYHSKQKDRAGKKDLVPYSLVDDKLIVADVQWEKIDDGGPGDLNGAWLITGRKQEGKFNPMTPGARKTMKILSGTRFQWIAYNSETGEFFGTGGGKYTSEGGKYIEHIEFFSRDNSRVGASLEFDYELKEGKWHHNGKSSKGEPISEIWSDRKSLGI